MEPSKRPREGLQKDRCLAFVAKLWEADTLAMFHHPVSATEIPGYYEVIKSPIDLSTIRKNIEDGKYNVDSDVQDDVALMISNALEFNERGTEWHDLAKRLRKQYLSMAQESGLAVDADAAFIPAKKARDDESTLRKAEAKYAEKLEDVLGDLEKEKEVPLEELRRRYNRANAANLADSGEDSEAGSGDDSDGSSGEDSDPSDEASSGSDDSAGTSGSDSESESESESLSD